MTPDEIKQAILDKLTAIRGEVESLSITFTPFDKVDRSPSLSAKFDEIVGMIESIEIAEPPSTTPGYDRFTDVAWNLTDDCTELSEEQYDWLDAWIKTKPDHLAYYIGNRADEDGTEWLPSNAKDSLVSMCVEKMTPEERAAWEALPDADEDDEDDEDYLDEDDYNGRKIT